jgi:hypothetical protein
LGSTSSLQTTNERKLAPDSDEYRALFRDFELLRITIEKHDIASQGKLSAPLQMTTCDQTKVYMFAKNDPQRSHIVAHRNLSTRFRGVASD